MSETLGNFPALDLNLNHGCYQQGDITLYLSWLLTDGDPCMVLLPTYRQHDHTHVIPCVVTLADAHKWAEETCEGPYVDLMAGQFAAHLGLDPLKRRDVLRVQSVVRDWLGDLIATPPLPSNLRQKAADMFITDNVTGQVIHKEVSDYV